MTTARLIAAITVLLFAASIVVMNWGCVIGSARNKRRGINGYHSTVPLMSFVLAAVAYVIYPHPDKIWMISVPLMDLANWRLLWLAVTLIRGPRRERTKGIDS